MAYADVDKLSRKLRYIFKTYGVSGVITEKVNKALNDSTADVVEVKDCNLCVFNSRHATEYPCSHCKNCYTDKFKPIE